MPKDKDEALQSAVAALRSTDAAERQKAAKTLLKAGLASYSHARKAILETDAAWSGLLDAMSGADAKLAETATAALAEVIGRYRRDLSAFEPLEALTRHKKKEIRAYAVRGLAFLEHPRRWKVIVPMLDDAAEIVQREASQALIHESKSTRRSELESAIPRLRAIAAGAADSELRLYAANAADIIASRP